MVFVGDRKADRQGPVEGSATCYFEHRGEADDE